MKVLGKLMTHFRLVGRMAKATDTDLVSAAQSGDLPQEEWAEMVQTCRRCQWAGRCDGWVDSHDHQDHAPGTCLNRERLDVLKAKSNTYDSERV